VTTAGYSGKPLIDKLGLKPGMVAAILNAPDGYLQVLDSKVPLADSLTSQEFHFIQVFALEKEYLSQILQELIKTISRDGMVWISWPKKSSKVATDIDENVIREICLPMGWVDVKVCAVTDVWSGLKLVIRKELR
jgi:hypothetical protein